MDVIRIDDKTIDQIAACGNRLKADAVLLENLIWLVKAESYKQLADAAGVIEDAHNSGGATPDQVKELSEAAARTTKLEKMWGQGVAIRNSTFRFGDMARNNAPAWQVLEEVMRRLLAHASGAILSAVDEPSYEKL